jgi:hypothetical protein
LTAIGLVIGKKGEIFGFSDLAISNEPGKPSLVGAQFPLFSGITPEATRLVENSKVTGFGQKSAIFGSHLVLWAGDRGSAHQLIDYMYRNQVEAEEKNINELATKVLGGRRGTICAIHANFTPSGKLRVSHFGCNTLRTERAEIILAGSGKANLFPWLKNSVKPSPGVFSNNFRIAVSALVELLSEECDGDLYDNGVGFHYEIATACRVGGTLGWRKMPYTYTRFFGDKYGFGTNLVLDTSYCLDTTLIRELAGDSAIITIDGWNYFQFRSLAPKKAYVASDMLANAEGTLRVRTH